MSEGSFQDAYYWQRFCSLANFQLKEHLWIDKHLLDWAWTNDLEPNLQVEVLIWNTLQVDWSQWDKQTDPLAPLWLLVCKQMFTHLLCYCISSGILVSAERPETTTKAGVNGVCVFGWHVNDRRRSVMSWAQQWDFWECFSWKSSHPSCHFERATKMFRGLERLPSVTRATICGAFLCLGVGKRQVE